MLKQEGAWPNCSHKVVNCPKCIGILKSSFNWNWVVKPTPQSTKLYTWHSAVKQSSSYLLSWQPPNPDSFIIARWRSVTGYREYSTVWYCDGMHLWNKTTRDISSVQNIPQSTVYDIITKWKQFLTTTQSQSGDSAQRLPTQSWQTPNLIWPSDQLQNSVYRASWNGLSWSSYIQATHHQVLDSKSSETCSLWPITLLLLDSTTLNHSITVLHWNHHKTTLECTELLRATHSFTDFIHIWPWKWWEHPSSVIWMGVWILLAIECHWDIVIPLYHHGILTCPPTLFETVSSIECCDVTWTQPLHFSFFFFCVQ